MFEVDELTGFDDSMRARLSRQAGVEWFGPVQSRLLGVGLASALESTAGLARANPALRTLAKSATGLATSEQRRSARFASSRCRQSGQEEADLIQTATTDSTLLLATFPAG